MSEDYEAEDDQEGAKQIDEAAGSEFKKLVERLKKAEEEAKKNADLPKV